MSHIATLLALVTGTALVGTFPTLALVALPPGAVALVTPVIGIGLLRARRARVR